MAKLAAAFDLLTRGGDKAAADIDHVGNSSERTAGKVDKTGRSMRLLASTFTNASNQALGPLQEIANKFDVIAQAQESASSKAGGRLLGIGAAGLGAGAFLSTLASREEGAAQQLEASIAATGHSYDDFTVQIDKATHGGERFGNQASETLDALNRLTLTTHNPTEALKDLAVAQDVAAAKHIPLAKAAEIVGLTFNGSTRAGKQFGLQLENTAGAVKGLASAQAAAKTANAGVVTAQQNYNDKLAVYNQTLKPTLAQQIALFRSHQAIAGAQNAAAAAAARLKAAQEKANSATDAGARNVKKLADITSGQASGAADTFAGHLRALGAHIEDVSGKFGKDYGGAINTASLVTIGLGTLVETGILPKIGRALAGLVGFGTQAATSAAEVGVAAVAEDGSLATVALASEGVTAAIQNIGPAAGVAAGEVGTATAVMDGELATTAAAATGLAAKLGAIGGAVVGLARFGPGAFPDLKSTAPSGLSAHQADLFTDALTQTKAARAALAKASQEDLQAVLATLSPTSNDKSIRSARALLSGLVGPRLSQDGRIGPDQAETDFLNRKHGRNSIADNTKESGKKVGKAAGDATLQGFLDSIGGGKAANAMVAAAAAEAARVAKQAAVDAATALRDAVKTQFEAAKQVLADVLDQAKQLRGSIADSLKQGSSITDVFGTGPNLNANHAFGPGHDFESVKRFFEERLVKLRRFAAELSALVHKGLDPAVVGQIASAGLDSGGRLADALSGASKGQLGTISNLNKQVTQIADASGKRVADAQFKAQIAADKRNTDALAHRLDEANRHLRVISREKPGANDPRAQAFLLGA